MARNHRRPVAFSSYALDRMRSSDRPNSPWAGGISENSASLMLTKLVRSDDAGSGQLRRQRFSDFVDSEGLAIFEQFSDTTGHDSLSSALRHLYQMRHSLLSQPVLASRVVEQGMTHLNTIDPFLLAVETPVETEAVRVIIDSVLDAVFSGEMASGLERAAALAKVVAFGILREADGHAKLSDSMSVLKWQDVARALSECASLEKSGQLR